MRLQRCDALRPFSCEMESSCPFIAKHDDLRPSPQPVEKFSNEFIDWMSELNIRIFHLQRCSYLIFHFHCKFLLLTLQIVIKMGCIGVKQSG